MAAPQGGMPVAGVDEKQQLALLYDEMYVAMMNKDRQMLEALHDDSFELRHMTGMVQSKREYIDSIMNGTLNYYSAQTEGLDISVTGDRARMTGRSRVNAAVFGGGRHTWPLQLQFDLIRGDGGWKLTAAKASTY